LLLEKFDLAIGDKMASPYTLFSDVGSQVEPPADGTLSKTLFQDERLKIVLFGFAAGQELSEHTAAVPAIMHFLIGEADVTLGAEKVVMRAGAWVHMAAQLPHSIRARSPVVMILSLLKETRDK
jgi:quercetin dioxygenase-like cupin family protein